MPQSYDTGPSYKELLHKAHERFDTVETQARLVQAPSAENGEEAIVEGTLSVSKDGKVLVYIEVGDCSPDSAPSSNIVPHKIRMAATRAKARCLRDALDVGETSEEEFGGSNGGVDRPPPRGGSGGAGSNGGRRSKERPARAEGSSKPASEAQMQYIGRLVDDWDAFEEEFGDPDEFTSSRANKIIQELKERA